MQRTVLWLSHILVRHDQADNAGVSFTYVDWKSVDPAPQRSREQALARAQELFAQLVRSPASFGDFALRHSEDATTREVRGSLGPVVAAQLAAWPQVLDGIEATAAGNVIGPVETESGFHLLLLAPPPAEDMLTGSHIVIAHDDATWLRVLQADAPHRERAAAKVLAQQVYERARARPEAFDELVRQYSDHRDAARNGDFGTWSTREVPSSGREIDSLRSLQIGEVAPPRETLIGLQIIKRVPNRERQIYAMRAIRVLFDPGFPEAAAATRERVFQLAREVAGDPDRFLANAASLKQGQVEQWQSGRSMPALEEVILALGIGQVAREPIRVANSYVLPQRVAPTAITSPETLFTLAPSRPDCGAQAAAP